MLDWTVRPVGHTLSLSGCRGQCGPGRKLPGTFPFPTRLPSSDVSLFPLAQPELWIHSSPAQLWANLSLPLPLPTPFLCHQRGVWCLPAPVTTLPTLSPMPPLLLHLPGLFFLVVWELWEAPSLSRCQPHSAGR